MGIQKKLITFQTMDACRSLICKGYLECGEKHIDREKSGYVYEWVLEKMQESVPNLYNAPWPVWCWARFKNGVCPPRHRGEPVDGFDVKITFHKEEKDIFLTDYRRFSFLLNNTYIPLNKEDKTAFDKRLEAARITAEDLKAYIRPDRYKSHRTDREYLDICRRIRDSFDRCVTTDSDVLQGCVWRISLEDVEKIEFLQDKDYTCGSFNYRRKNGKRFDWIEDYYKKYLH